MQSGIFLFSFCFSFIDSELNKGECYDKSVISPCLGAVLMDGTFLKVTVILYLYTVHFNYIVLTLKQLL